MCSLKFLPDLSDRPQKLRPPHLTVARGSLSARVADCTKDTGWVLMEIISNLSCTRESDSIASFDVPSARGFMSVPYISCIRVHGTRQHARSGSSGAVGLSCNRALPAWQAQRHRAQRCGHALTRLKIGSCSCFQPAMAPCISSSTITQIKGEPCIPAPRLRQPGQRVNWRQGIAWLRCGVRRCVIED